MFLREAKRCGNFFLLLRGLIYQAHIQNVIERGEEDCHDSLASGYAISQLEV